MTLHYPKARKAENADKTIQFLNDLLKINNDRIAGYQKAVEQPGVVDRNLRGEFSKIIAEAILNQELLIKKINERNGNATLGTTIMGKIYTAWMDLKVAFAGNTQKTIISSCLYNEEIALYAYRAALNMDIGLDDELKEMVEEQEQTLIRAHNRIKGYRESRHVADYSLVYFN